MSEKILTESFEIKSDLFIKKHFPDVILNDDDAQSFRENGVKYTFIDPYYKDSITAYMQTDGSIFIDSFLGIN